MTTNLDEFGVWSPGLRSAPVPVPDRKRLLSIPEAAASLGIGESLFRSEVLGKSALVETVRIGARVLVVPASLDTYISHIRSY